MTRLRLLLLLTRWEFMRYFRWRDLLLSIGVSVGLILGIAVVGKLLKGAAARAEPMQLAVVGEPPFALPAATRDFAWVKVGGEVGEGAPATIADLDDAMETGRLDAYLEFESHERGTIVCESDGAWLDALRAALTNARREARIRAHGLDTGALDDILMPFSLDRVHATASAEPDEPDAAARRHDPSKAEKILAIAFMVIMFMGIMTGTSYLFMGITSEKQARVTEQIVAATPPQMWIDGKILGAAARSSLSLGLIAAQCLLGVVVWLVFVASEPSSLSGLFDFRLVPVFALLAVLGFALWFCFFAALAATINDPNTSYRGVFLLLPILSGVLAFPVYLNPTGPLALVLGLVPITSPVALPMRMVLAGVAWWEVPVAVVALVGAIRLTRRGAGKVFALGIMMHGKEPSWRDMWRAFRAG